MPEKKIATCTYCGTRAALVLDAGRHELACSSCGAPLHDLKRLKAEPDARPAAQARPLREGRPLQDRWHEDDLRGAMARTRKKPKKSKKSLGKKALGGLWDAIEDIFD